MKKYEQKFTTLFLKWVKNEFKKTAAFEIKSTRGKDYIAFNEIKDHQIRALQIAKHAILSYKISDFDMIGYKPFDCFCLAKVLSYIVIKYPKFFCLIDIDDFVKEKEQSKRKSLTSQRAKEITSIVI